MPVCLIRRCEPSAIDRLRSSGPPYGENDMGATTKRQILDAQGRIADPDKGADIVSLGMVSGLAIRDGNVAFAIEVESERGPRLEPLRKAAEKAVEALPGVLSVTAGLTGGRLVSARRAGRCPGSVRSSQWRPAKGASANRRWRPISRWGSRPTA